MQNENIITKLGINPKMLDFKKQQTTYKIEFVSTYITNWLYVNTNREEVANIVFIDCMCNAGVYSDGELGTSMRVLEQFQSAAQRNPSKNFHLILNDYNKERIEICKTIVSEITKKHSTKNLTVYVSNQDVNDFLGKLEPFDKLIKWKAATVLFVDPYDFVTVSTQTLKQFIQSYYCEVVYNFFSSDFWRNKKSDRIKQYLGVSGLKSIGEAENQMRAELKVGKMKYSFSYVFKNVKNAELYRILFFTPNIVGLEKLKEALWETFKGKAFHRNERPHDSDQLSLWSETDEKALLVSSYAFSAKELLTRYFSGKTVPYNEIECYLLENTMMMKTQIIGNVIKPLIEEGKLAKCGLTNVTYNYKGDSYSFPKEPE